jgi:hypothetical protein
MPAADHASTPGQKLLTTLQQTSVGRLDRYQKTAAAVQSKAAQSIPAAPKPPGRNDLGNAPVKEVHQLQADVPRAQGSMQGVLAMLQNKERRHAAVWDRYQASRQQADERHRAAAAAAAEQSRVSLAALSSSIEQDMSVLADDRVMVLDEEQLQQVSCCGNYQNISACHAPEKACM